MTTARRYGDDNPFGAWVRSRKDLDSHQFGMTLNDADWIFHRYRVNTDSVGTRDIQFMMLVETKTRQAVPADSQKETLFFLHQMLKRKSMLRRPGRSSVALWCYGAFVLSMSGTNPVDSPIMNWGRFNEHGSLIWSRIKNDLHLAAILRFDLSPDCSENISVRRHHKNDLIEVCEDRGLFKVPKHVVRRS